MRKKTAIIDLGSNSVRMLIMRLYKDGSYKMIDQAKEMVRLSEHMGEEKTLKEAAINRTVKTLKLFRKLADAHNIDEVQAVATAAVRNALNQAEFLETVEKETGFTFEVITGQQEAYFDYVATVNTIELDNCIIIDIGGASTELIWMENRRLRESVSIPIGAVILSEKFAEKGNVSDECATELKNYIQDHLNSIPWLTQTGSLPIVGLGGSLRCLAKIDKKLHAFPLEGLHHYQLSAETVTNICKMVIGTTLEERIAIPGLDKDRADIIPGGFMLLHGLIHTTQAPHMVVSENGLREGVFFARCLKSEDQDNGIVKDVLAHSIDNILKNFEMNIPHCYHVQKLALASFDQLSSLHGMGREERKILSAAALLHDIGEFINYYNHHKHGLYLVLNARLNGLTNKELVMCALLVSMHTTDDYKPNWKQYQPIIDKADFKIIKKLSLFLRIAEQLDRSEFGTITDLTSLILPNQVKITINTDTNPELEIAEALKNRKDFKKRFDKDLVIEKNT